MSARLFRLVFISPLGEVFDASARLDLDNLGSVGSIIESDLSVITHGDFALTLDNSDGLVEQFFENASPTDSYEMILERKRLDGPSWDRVFGGVLDIVSSLSYDDKAKTAHVVAYTYSKILDRTPADTIKRTLALKTANINADSNVLVFIAGETDDLEVGDVVELVSSTGRKEEFVINAISSSSQAVAVDTSSQVFTNALAVVKSQFYHDRTPEFLLGEIATATGLDIETLDLQLDVAEFPIATPYTLSGLSLNRRPVSLVPSGTDVIATFDVADETERQVGDGPTGTWVDGATSNVPQGDWTPYLTSEPGSIMASLNGGTTDNGFMAWDHTNSHVWHIVAANTGTPTFLNRLNLYRDGVNLGFFASIVDSEDYVSQSLEYDPVNDRVWVSRSDTATPSVRVVRWIPAAGGSYTTFDSTVSGYLRMCRALNMLILVDDVTYDIRMYDLTTLTLVRVIPFTLGVIYAWTMRAWEGWFTFVYSVGGLSRIAIYETQGWTLVAGYVLSETPPVHGTFITTQTLDGGGTVLVAFVGDEWLVLALRYAGVVRYADFGGSSCGAAVRDLALITNCLINVDNFKTVRLANRLVIGQGETVHSLDDPLSSVRTPVSSVYRESVLVSGQTRLNEKIEVIIGDAGKSASRLSVDSALITTTGMAVAAGISLYQFVNHVRSQVDATILDEDLNVTALQRVTMLGRRWFVYKIQTDLEQGTHNVTLLELLP